MKTRKRVTSFLLALAVVIALIVTPSVDAQAATYVYSPTNIVQTAAKKKQIEVRWDAAKNAVSYNVYVRVGGSTGQICMSGNVKSNGATLNGVIPGVTYYIEVKSVGADGSVSYSSTKYLYSVPAKPKNVFLYQWTNDSSSPYLEWQGYNKNQTGYYIPKGYEVKVMTLAGGNIKTFKTSGAYLYNKIAKVKNAGFKVKIRSYYIVNEYSSNGTAFKVYSAWSDVKAFVPQTKAGARWADRDTTAKLSWKPIKNASSYNIYKITGTGTNVKLTKLKTVPGSATSTTVPRHIRLAVFPTVKVGGRKYKASYKDRQRFYTLTIN